MPKRRSARFRDDASAALTELYERLPPVDFSRQVVQQAASSLRVIRAPACGWNDLGTPRRVADTLQRLAVHRELSPTHRSETHFLDAPGLVNLAAQHLRLALGG